jgi:threonine dehydratase
MMCGAEIDITLERIRHTERLVRPHIRTTPILEVPASDFELNFDRIVFKLELCQHAGSFKVRGAFANLLTRELPAAGVVAASGGNHGLAVAYAANKLGIPARIFVPSVASPVKVAKIREYGAQLEIVGDRYADALAASKGWIEKSGALEIHAYDSLETLLGQATLAWELERQAPDLDTVLIAVGGGGLIGGVAAYFARGVAEHAMRVIGVEPESAPTLTCALRAGKPVDSPAGGIAADSLAPKRVGDLMLPIAQQSVDRVVLVSDDAILNAQQALWDRVRIVAEPGGATALAAVLSGQYVPEKSERVAIVLCGGNTTAVDFQQSAQ